MKTFLLLLCAGILVFIGYRAFTSNSPNIANNKITAVPFRYGEAASYLYRPSYSRPTNSSGSISNMDFPNSVKLTRKDRNQFKGLFDLPKDCFIYVVKNLSKEDLNRLMMYGILLIRHHPKKVDQYSYRLSVCHMLFNRATDELDQEPDMMPIGRNHYLPERSLFQSAVAGNDLVDLLPGSTFIPYKSLAGLLSSLLTFLYYTTTTLCCLLVAGFIGYHLLHLPWQQSVSLTLSPRPEEFSTPYCEPNKDSLNS